MISSSSNSERDSIITDLMPDLTPLIDVMFMLIIFLVLTTSSVKQVFNVDLPEDKEDVAASIKSNDVLSITVFGEDSKWGLNGVTYEDENSFKQSILKEYKEGREVIIFGDKNTRLEKFMKILTFLRSNNIEAADIVME